VVDGVMVSVVTSVWVIVNVVEASGVVIILVMVNVVVEETTVVGVGAFIVVVV
jgi:hypothetical protein